jgi:hypothetical protein
MKFYFTEGNGVTMTPPKPTFPSEEARRWLRIAANVATILGFLLATTTALGWL